MEVFATKLSRVQYSRDKSMQQKQTYLFGRVIHVVVLGVLQVIVHFSKLQIHRLVFCDVTIRVALPMSLGRERNYMRTT